MYTHTHISQRFIWVYIYKTFRTIFGINTYHIDITVVVNNSVISIIILQLKLLIPDHLDGYIIVIWLNQPI